jgi:glycosyltransferase involved in cell wall biosynthesis
MDYVGHVHIVGDGPERSNIKSLLDGSLLNATFHGFLDRDSVFEILAQSHILVLPSSTEGFPKVIAEAWCYGCVPVVSQVSAIDQYVINGVNGFLIPPENRNPDGLRNILVEMITRFDIRKIATQGYKEANRFTYDYYIQRLRNEVIVQ